MADQCHMPPALDDSEEADASDAQSEDFDSDADQVYFVFFCFFVGIVQGLFSCFFFLFTSTKFS